VTARVAVIGVLLFAPAHVSVYMSLPAALGVTVIIPLVGFEPLQAPLAVHEVAPIDDHVRVAL
jgi:hypothetical protein